MPGCNRTSDVTGLTHAIATSVHDIREAWGLVYRAYVRAGLIDPNPLKIHTTREAIGSETAVVLGRIGDLAVNTISSYLDSPRGLPLDRCYEQELDALRREGRSLLEVGLFADRREQVSRSLDSLLELMRYAFYFGVHSNADDLVIGVHPRHSPFYVRLIGFEVAGAEKAYATVRDHPVVLLRLDLKDAQQRARTPRGLRYFLDRPLSAEIFDSRCRLTAHDAPLLIPTLSAASLTTAA